ncbi:MAG: conjugal transfer protein TraX [Treponema sp.]|nr:conjugal transfer protein TraX [Treponema sp.]
MGEINNTEKKNGLTGNILKFIAILAMTLDHFAWFISLDFSYSWWTVVMHFIGRMTMPIMCFMIVEGYYHTRSIKKYLLRLFIFAVISHFPYNFFLEPSVKSLLSFRQTSIIWPLFCSVCALLVIDNTHWEKHLEGWQEILLILITITVSMPGDWFVFPVLCVLVINKYRGNLTKQWIGVLVLMSLMGLLIYFTTKNVLYAFSHFAVIIDWPLMALYNGERGKWKGMKWFFYIYYPLHLLIFGLIKFFMN